MKAKNKPKPADWREAAEHLRAADPVLGRIIDSVGPCGLKPRRDYFTVLCKSIFSQQISTKVAATLFARFCGQFPRQRPTPERVVELLTCGDEARISISGLSKQKRAYVLDLARHFAAGEIPTARFARMSDEEIIESLTRVHGIGRWTVEMFLMFVLNRPDVLPVDDLGLRAGVREVYRMRKMPTKQRLRKIAKPWHPYCSVATWYIWRRRTGQEIK